MWLLRPTGGRNCLNSCSTLKHARHPRASLHPDVDPSLGNHPDTPHILSTQTSILCPCCTMVYHGPCRCNTLGYANGSNPTLRHNLQLAATFSRQLFRNARAAKTYTTPTFRLLSYSTRWLCPRQGFGRNCDLPSPYVDDLLEYICADGGFAQTTSGKW